MARKIWDEKSIREFTEQHNHEFIEMIEFNNIRSLIKIRCKNKNHKPFEIKFVSFRKTMLEDGNSCKECKKEAKMLKREDIENLMNEKGLIWLDGDYISSDTKNLLVWCGNPNHKPFLTSQNYILCNNGNSCKECGIENNANNKRHPYEYIYNYIKNEGDELLSNTYINNSKSLEIRCGKCGEVFKTTFGHYQNNDRRCLCKAQSRGEAEIKRIFDKYGLIENIDYECQKKYKGLVGVGGRQLSYDFYINNTLIEYQGSYHDGTARKQTDEGFEVQKEHDKRKRNYAKDNNIKLLEIWYWDFNNIENILIKELNLI